MGTTLLADRVVARCQTVATALRGGPQESDVEPGNVRDPHCAACEFEKGNTESMVGASHTIADVMPVSAAIWGGLLRGSASVPSSPNTTPPRTLTAAILGDRVVIGPVTSGATAGGLQIHTTNVVSRSDVSASGSMSAKLNWPMF